MRPCPDSSATCPDSGATGNSRCHNDIAGVSFAVFPSIEHLRMQCTILVGTEARPLWGALGGVHRCRVSPPSKTPSNCKSSSRFPRLPSNYTGNSTTCQNTGLHEAGVSARWSNWTLRDLVRQALPRRVWSALASREPLPSRSPAMVAAQVATLHQSSLCYSHISAWQEHACLLRTDVSQVHCYTGGGGSSSRCAHSRRRFSCCGGITLAPEAGLQAHPLLCRGERQDKYPSCM